MSSANNKKNGSLEDAFRNRMQDAEATPAPDIWSRIDHDLTVQENLQYRKRAVFYRQLAAACFILFMMAGAVLVYQFNTADQAAGIALEQQQVTTQQNNKGNLAQQEPTTQTGAIEGNVSDGPSHVAKASGQETTSYKKTTESITAQKLAVSGTDVTSSQTIASSTANVLDLKAQPTENTIAGHNATTQGITGSPATQQAKGGSMAQQSILMQSPTIMSLMAKDQQKLSDLAADTKPEKENLTKALALELNKDKKDGSKSDKEKSNSRWSMSIGYMPTYFAQNIGLPDEMVNRISTNSLARFGPSISAETTANMEKARDEYENNTTPAFSYAIDVKGGFKLGKKLKLLAGFGFSQNAARTKTSYLVEQFWHNPKTDKKVELTPSTIFLPSLNNSFTTDSISVTATDPFEVDYRYRMVSLPIGLQFEDEITNGWNWYVASGVAANIMLKSSVTSSREDVVSVTYDHQDDSPFRRTQFSGNVGLGVSKQITNDITVSVGPEFRGYFNTMLSEPKKAIATQGKPYTLGLNMSLNYQLGSLKK